MNNGMTLSLSHNWLCGYSNRPQNLQHQQQTPSHASALLQSKAKPVSPVCALQLQQQHVVHEPATTHLAPIPESAVIAPTAAPEVVVTSNSCCCLQLFGSGLIIIVIMRSSLTNHITIFFLLFSSSSWAVNVQKLSVN